MQSIFYGGDFTAKKKRRTKRAHSIIDELPKELREEVEELIAGNAATYAEITDYLISKGVQISSSSVARYAKKYIEELEILKISQENLRMINKEIEKHPELDTAEGLMRIASGAMLGSVADIAPEEFDEMSPAEKIKLTTGLIRASAYKRRVENQNQDTGDKAIEVYIAHLNNVIAAEAPELYAQLVEFLKSKKGTDLTKYSEDD